jgi:hypothetical protein
MIGPAGTLAAQAHIAQRCEATEGGGRSHKPFAEKDREWAREKQRLMRSEA